LEAYGFAIVKVFMISGFGFRFKEFGWQDSGFAKRSMTAHERERERERVCVGERGCTIAAVCPGGRVPTPYTLHPTHERERVCV